MVSKYVVSFLLLFALVCLVLSMLPFATHSQVIAGTSMDETWTNEFTLDASSDQIYPVDADIVADLEKGLHFVGSGSVHVDSESVQVTPATVSWTENRRTYSAPGARMIVHIVWDAANSVDGRGDIHVAFPAIRGVPSFNPSFHAGPAQRTGDGRWLFREITAYPSTAGAQIGRIVFAATAALPIAIGLHSIWWAFQLKSRKKELLAQLRPAGDSSLPRVFFSSPIAEWSAWTLVLVIFSFVGILMASFGIYDGYQSTFLRNSIYVATAVALVAATIAVLYTRATVLTVRIDDQGIAYTKGRSAAPPVTCRWSDLKRAAIGTKTERGRVSEWIELIFPDGKVRKIPSDIIDYPVLREAVQELYSRHRT